MTTPQNPEDVSVIREIAPGVTTVSVPFLRGGKFKFGGRATIVTLPSNNLAVFSPVALTPALQSHLQTLGSTVTYLVAPDIEHHIFLSAWATAFPSAHIIAPEGLAEKRAQMNQTDKAVTILNFGTIFTAKEKSSPTGIKVSEEFDSAFYHEYVDAHPNKELVFFHKASKTMITADLIFNLPGTEQYSKTGESASSGIWTKLFNSVANTKGEAVWQKRLLWYGFSKADRSGFNASAQRINTWGIENIVMGHGDTIVGGGGAVFQKVFQWHLAGKK